MIRIVSHKKLCQENAWIEASPYRLIDLAFLCIDKSIDFPWELFKSGDKSRVNLFRKIDVEMLGAAW